MSDLKKWKDLYQEDPENELVLISLAKAYLDAEMYLEASRSYQSLVELQPDFALAWALLARSHLRLGELDKARLTAQEALRLAVHQKHEVPEMEARSVLDELDAEF